VAPVRKSGFWKKIKKVVIKKKCIIIKMQEKKEEKRQFVGKSCS
jgi:hypothetical protein